MLFSFFKKQTVTPDLSFLGVDMHSHLLPGIDDGLKTVEQTVAFVKELHALGYKKLICTPHILNGVHNNTVATINAALDIARKALADAQVPVVLEAAAEYMIDDEFENKINEKEELLTFGKNNILVEMSYLAESNNLLEVIFRLQMAGYHPILAHPERYNFYHGNFDKYEELKDRQVLFQLNILSLSGYYGKEIKKVSEKLLAKGMYDFIGTDMHHETHLAATKAFVATKEFYDLVKNTNLHNQSLL